MELRPVQALKAFCPIVSTPSEIVTELRFTQFRNALSPMFFTLEGIATEIMEEPLNALLPIVVTLVGIFTLRTLLFKKTPFPILVTPGSITTLRILLLFSFHGCSSALLKSGIAPLPEIVSVPAFVKFQLSPPSRVPLSIDVLASGSSGET